MTMFYIYIDFSFHMINSSNKLINWKLLQDKTHFGIFNFEQTPVRDFVKEIGKFLVSFLFNTKIRDKKKLKEE